MIFSLLEHDSNRRNHNDSPNFSNGIFIFLFFSKTFSNILSYCNHIRQIKVATPIGLEHLFQVQSKNKWFPWDAILQSAIMNKNTKRYRHKLIFVSNPRIVEKLREVLVNTPKRVFANYMLFKVVESNLMGTFEGYGYFTESKNPDIDSATNEICQNFTREYINVYGLVNYVNSFSGELFKSDILKSGIIENIKNQFLTEFKRVSFQFVISL